MSDDRSGTEKRIRDIDLGKDAVRDVTPEVAPESSSAKPEVTTSENERVSATAAAQAPASRSIAPVVGGAVAGGVLGLLSAVFFQNFERPPVTVADPRVAQVEAAIAVVERKALDAAQIEQRVQAQLKAAEGRIGGIAQQAEGAGQRAAAVEGRAAALEQKAAALEQKAAAAEQRAAAAEQRVAEAEARARAAVAPVVEQVRGLETRIAENREQNAAIVRRVDLLAQIEPPKVDLRPIVTKVDELERAVGSNAARVTLNGETTLAIDGRLKGLEQGIKGIEGSAKAADAAIKANEAAIKALESGIAAAGRRPVETANAVLAASNLARRALERGEVTAGPVAALSALGIPEASLNPVSAFSQQPAPSLAGLADLYADLAAKVPKPTPPAAAPPKSESFVDRMTSGLWSQVEVRQVGTTSKPDATGLAPQIRQKLLAGDLAGVQGLVATLSPEQQAALKPFSDAVAARIAAIGALQSIEQGALTATSRKG